jgi:hypothetical protein
MFKSFTAAEFAAVRSLAEDMPGYLLLERMCNALEQIQQMTAIIAQTLDEDDDAEEDDAHLVVCLHLASHGSDRAIAA